MEPSPAPQPWLQRMELDDYVDGLAHRLASFEAQALAATKRLVRGRAFRPTLDDYREALEDLRALVVLSSTNARRSSVARHAAAVGSDFELRMGHHLGLVAESPECGRENRLTRSGAGRWVEFN